MVTLMVRVQAPTWEFRKTSGSLLPNLFIVGILENLAFLQKSKTYRGQERFESWQDLAIRMIRHMLSKVWLRWHR